MSTCPDALFSPFTCKSLHVPNRIVMAPMTRSFSPRGIPTEEVAAYYRRRAEGGVGLIIAEGAAVDRPGAVDATHIPHFHGEAPLAGWRRVADEVRTAGASIAPQLWHIGAAPRQPHHVGGLTGEPESPSGRFSATADHGRAMSDEDIADTIAAFARASADAKRLGFAATQFHAAHGYLFDQFFWDVCNLRTDAWGGPDLASRSRFAIEAVRATRAAVGEDFPIMLRISQWKQQDYGVKLADGPAELERWLGPLADAGVDIFDCSQRRFWTPEFDGSDLNLAGWVKKVTGKPTITVGSVGLATEFLSTHRDRSVIRADVARIDDLVRRLDRGDFDLVGVGRALLADPEWPGKLRDGRAGEMKDYSILDRERLH
ncbi:NADH:flavin oxidoreductase [Sphingomonas sp. YL-JM2C]